MTGDEVLQPMTDEDRRLLLAVLRWLYRSGGERLPGDRGHHTGDLHRTWRRNGSSVMSLGKSMVSVHRPGLPCCLVGATTVTEMISMLAEMGLLPARFSALGRAALDAHAEECERYATHLLIKHRIDLRRPALAGWATAWKSAGDAARRFDAAQELS